VDWWVSAVVAVSDGLGAGIGSLRVVDLAICLVGAAWLATTLVDGLGASCGEAGPAGRQGAAMHESRGIQSSKVNLRSGTEPDSADRSGAWCLAGESA
jgi:hypothetical protein